MKGTFHGTSTIAARSVAVPIQFYNYNLACKATRY